MYRITLIQGQYFAKGQNHCNEFFKSLFQDFSMLSWLNQHLQIKILNEIVIPLKNSQCKIYQFTSHNGESILKIPDEKTDANVQKQHKQKSDEKFGGRQLPKHNDDNQKKLSKLEKYDQKNRKTVRFNNIKNLVQFNKSEKQGSIQYFLTEKDVQEIPHFLYQRNSKGCPYHLKVVISQRFETSKLYRKNKQNEIQKQAVIYIEIEDKLGIFKSLEQQKFGRTLYLKKKLKDNQIEYFYKEPLTKRNKETQSCHFSLAFQGGGAKGVSYVGVYKALKELHRGIPINSIIGSSAGGILALAISTQMIPDKITQLCLKMQNIPKDKYYRTDAQITAKDQDQFDEHIEKLKCILHNQRILEDKIFDQLVSILSDLQTSERILNVLHQINPSLQKLFTLQIKQTLGQGANSFKKYTKKFNYYGFLKGGLMKGNAVEDLAAQCLVDYFCKHFSPQQLTNQSPESNQRALKIAKILQSWGINSKDQKSLRKNFEKSQNLDKIKQFTLKQLYDINGVQFTCTSVDLDDKILRFFNHKTTPDLPVCKTVQMSGSFPVAFMAQTWKQEWGKYFIHYSKSRKEIDLTGHTFTDGGLLANFPVKYLDNELMRPMYFSHKKNPKYTILYGFGLDQIQSKNDDDTKGQDLQQKKQTITDLTNHIKSKLSKLELLKNLILSDSKKELPQAKLEDIPFLNFIVKLFRTFSVADYNLNIQCFQKNIIVTEIQRQLICQKKNAKIQVKKFVEFKNLLENLKNCTESKIEAQPSELITASCNNVINLLNEFETSNSLLIETIRNNFLISLYNYEGTRIKHQYKQSSQINELIRRIQSLYPSQLFKTQDISLVKADLLYCITALKDYFSSLSGQMKNEVKDTIINMIKQQLLKIQQAQKRVKTIIQTLQKHENEISNEAFNTQTLINFQLIFQLANMEKKNYIIDQTNTREFLENIYKLDLPIVKCENQIIQNINKISAQLHSMVKHGEHNKIHLVLQARGNSHFHFCSLFQIMQNLLNQPENSCKSIDFITTSGLQSVFAFLYVGGKKMSNIRKQMWKMKDLLTIQDNIFEEYEKFNWAKTAGREMQELLQLTWSDHYNIFNEMQKYLMKEGDDDLAKQVEEMRTEFLYSKGVVTRTMEDILDYLTRSCYEAIKIKDDPALQRKRLSQFLSLKNGHLKDYKAKNQMISENTKNFIKKLMLHFEGILVKFLLNHPLISQTFDCSDPITAEKVWKGVLVKKLLSSKKLELYIKDALQQLRLNSSTTLAQYYDFCPRKITSNFVLVNKNQERVQMVNRFTRPNMPVWAAIIASTSMPMLLPDVDPLQEWQFSPFLDSNMRKLVNYFFSNPEDKLQQSFFSANFVSTLPLELLTNQKLAKKNFTNLREKQERFKQENKLTQATTGTNSLFSSKGLYDDYQHTFITFAFQTIDSEKPKQDKKITKIGKPKKFLNFSNFLNIGLDALRGKFKNVEVGFKDILKRLQVVKSISIRLQCHDNTIMNLYFDQTVKLPIQLGTLDFYKIQKDQDKILHHCIYQSQFVVRGIFQNLWISENKQDFGYQAKKQTYMQYQLIQKECKEETKSFIKLKFISKSKWNKKLATMYRVFWKLDLQGNYIEYDEDSIIFQESNKQIYLKFDYPDMQRTVRKTHQIIMNFQKLVQVTNVVFFKFNYEKLDKKLIIPIPLFTRRLRTRLIPNTNLHISESNIHEVSAQAMVFNHALLMSQRREPEQLKYDQIKEFCQQKVENQHNSKRIKFKKSIEKLQQYESKSQIQRNIQYSCFLSIKTKVNLKHDGLLCQGCIKPLMRVKSILKNEISSSNVYQNLCVKCQNRSGIIGYECQTINCCQSFRNRYCFKCLFVYLFQIKDGACFCRQQNHKLQYVNFDDSKEVVLCHFCQSASLSYYRDICCNINLCFKCSLILDSKKQN